MTEQILIQRSIHLFLLVKHAKQTLCVSLCHGFCFLCVFEKALRMYIQRSNIVPRNRVF